MVLYQFQLQSHFTYQFQNTNTSDKFHIEINVYEHSIHRHTQRQKQHVNFRAACLISARNDIQWQTHMTYGTYYILFIICSDVANNLS